ncbi:MAG: response regulator [Alphaproteobacteria bacterium]
MKSCLVVDDSQVIRTIARRILEKHRLAIEEATNGSEALEHCKRVMPDVVLVDWKMPVMNGLDFLKALRNLEEGKRAIVVFCTTENDPKYIETAIQAGANEYIMKPFDSEILQSKFEQVGVL